eukprot:scaffold1282_cov251-Pinguiococcus_pyrenoidosus.AAC.14
MPHRQLQPVSASSCAMCFQYLSRPQGSLGSSLLEGASEAGRALPLPLRRGALKRAVVAFAGFTCLPVASVACLPIAPSLRPTNNFLLPRLIPCY